MSAMVRARWIGSLGSGGFGRPWATSQNEQRRVHTSPRIMKVAVPWLKHSWMFGQLASSHTVTRWFSRNFDFSLATALPAGMRTRIQLGLRRTGALSSNFTGLRAILSSPSCLTPSCKEPTTVSGMDLEAASDMRDSGGKGDGFGEVWQFGGELRMQAELSGKFGDQHRLDDGQVGWAAQFYHRGHRQTGITAGIYPCERLQIHIDVERQTVEG